MVVPWGGPKNLDGTRANPAFSFHHKMVEDFAPETL